METPILTSYRRRRLYDLAENAASEGMDGGTDLQHLVVHALAQTSDGPLEVRDDYGSVGEDDWSAHEQISGSIDFWSIPETDPDAVVSIVVRITAPQGVVESERFDERDLFLAIAASSREAYPVDYNGAPVLPTFALLDVSPLDVVERDRVAPDLA